MSDDDRHESHEQHLAQLYERMLEQLRTRFAEAEDRVPRLREALEQVKQRMIALGEATSEDAEHVGKALRRDLEEAGSWLADSRHELPLRDWLRMDLQMLESWIWDAFASVADRTRLELEGFTTTGEPSLYHTGELAGPGQLSCIACGRLVTLQRAGPIPPCPGCTHTDFVRAAHASGDTDEGERS